MKRKFLILISFLQLFIPPVIYAQNKQPGNAQINLGNNQQFGVKAVGNPNATVGNLIASGLQIAAIFATLAVLVFLVWGAFDWITSGGDKEKIAGARRKIVNAIIGLFILALATFIVTLFGDIVGINPFNMGQIPQLGQQVQPRTTP